MYPAVYGNFFNDVKNNSVNLQFYSQHLSFLHFNDVLVDDGAVLDIVFEEFTREVPSGYDKIMLEQSLLET